MQCSPLAARAPIFFNPNVHPALARRVKVWSEEVGTGKLHAIAQTVSYVGSFIENAAVLVSKVLRSTRLINVTSLIGRALPLVGLTIDGLTYLRSVYYEGVDRRKAIGELKQRLEIIGSEFNDNTPSALRKLHALYREKNGIVIKECRRRLVKESANLIVTAVCAALTVAALFSLISGGIALAVIPPVVAVTVYIAGLTLANWHRRERVLEKMRLVDLRRIYYRLRKSMTKDEAKKVHFNSKVDELSHRIRVANDKDFFRRVGDSKRLTDEEITELYNYLRSNDTDAARQIRMLLHHHCDNNAIRRKIECNELSQEEFESELRGFWGRGDRAYKLAARSHTAITKSLRTFSKRVDSLNFAEVNRSYTLGFHTHLNHAAQRLR